MCLGIVGTTSKALRVVLNKVYQAAAAGCAVITSDTAPQRGVLAAAGLYIPPGDPAALAAALPFLAESPDTLWRTRRAAYQHAATTFTPEAVTRPLRETVQAPHSGWGEGSSEVEGSSSASK
jgi:glycosyltransferase involved in cell wall biosynthesis